MQLITTHLSIFILLLFAIPTSDAKTGIEAVETNLIAIDTIPLLLSEKEKEEASKLIEYMPHFPGCEGFEDKNERKRCSDNAIIQFINQNIVYPTIARENGIEGTAVIRFVVEKNGKITFDSDMRRVILRDPGGGCGAEALKVIAAMPNWSPGKVGGAFVRVEFTLPIKFKLSGDETVKKITVKWNGMVAEGQQNLDHPDKTTELKVSLNGVKSVLTSKSKNFAIKLKGKKYLEDFPQYHLSNGEKGKQFVIFDDTKNKSAKKQLFKELKSGDSLYFYTTKHKRCFLIMRIN